MKNLLLRLAMKYLHWYFSTHRKEAYVISYIHGQSTTTSLYASDAQIAVIIAGIKKSIEAAEQNHSHMVN